MINIKYFLLFVIGLALGGGAIIFYHEMSVHKTLVTDIVTTKTQKPAHTPFTQDNTPSKTNTGSIQPTTTITPATQPSSSIQVSPDGKMRVITQIKTHPNSTWEYSFFVAPFPVEDQPSQLIYNKTLNTQSSMLTPFNTFSPDDNFVFLQDNEPDMTHFLVFNSSGEAFSNGDQYRDVSSLFKQYTSAYQLYNVTGWASNSLLIIETQINNQPSTSFWFDVNNESFTPLATRF